MNLSEDLSGKEHERHPKEVAAHMVQRRRARLRAELDALYARVYGLTRAELSFIPDAFPLARRKDEAQCREYRTNRMVMKAYQAWEERFG
jgi:hypothetical protein